VQFIFDYGYFKINCFVLNYSMQKDPIQILTEAVVQLTAVTERIERKLKEITGD
jgi:hypothetical protein